MMRLLLVLISLVFAFGTCINRASAGTIEYEYSKFWAHSGVISFYAYGESADLSDVYDFFEMLQLNNNELKNPMKKMRNPENIGYWASTWDYTNPLDELRRMYCTDYTAAIALLEVLCFDDAYNLIHSDKELKSKYTDLFEEYSSACLGLLSKDIPMVYDPSLEPLPENASQEDKDRYLGWMEHLKLHPCMFLNRSYNLVQYRLLTLLTITES